VNAVVLIDPKYPHNVGGALRACAAFGSGQLFWTGQRIRLDSTKSRRLPREERMRGYRSDVVFGPDESALDRLILDGLTPVAVELKSGSEPLDGFEHPEHAVYVFGPEDGSVPKGVLHVCHRFVHIPTRYSLNLAAAVNVVLYDRRLKRRRAGLEETLPLRELLAPPDPPLAGVKSPPT